MVNQKMINIREEIKLRLDKLKLCKGDSYGEVINSLIDFWNMNNPLVAVKEEIIPDEIITSTNTSAGN